MGGYQSGQMGLTVTQLSFDFGGSNPSPPTPNCGSSSVDRASAFQAEGREFEPRLPLYQVSTPQLKPFFITLLPHFISFRLACNSNFTY